MKKSNIISKELLKALDFKLCKPKFFENIDLPYYAKDNVLLFFNNSPPNDTFLVGHGFMHKGKYDEGVKYYASTMRWINKPKELEEFYSVITGNGINIVDKSKKCDICGNKFVGKFHDVYDENFNKEEGLIQCDKCFKNSITK